MNKIWRVYPFYGQSFFVELMENGKVIEFKYINAHCLACAKSDLMAKTGILADIRGWHKQGLCGSFLRAMRDTVNMEKVEG